MSEIATELKAAECCRAALARYGIHDRACTMVLFAMVDGGLSYVEAVKAWAEYETPGGWDAVGWHDHIFRCLVRAWVDESPGLFFDKMEEEVLTGAH